MHILHKDTFLDKAIYEFNVHSFILCIGTSWSYSHFQWHSFNISGNGTDHISKNKASSQGCGDSESDPTVT